MKFKTLKNLAKIASGNEGIGVAVIPTDTGDKVIACSRYSIVEKQTYDYSADEPVNLSSLDADYIKNMSAKDGNAYFSKLDGKNTIVIEEKGTRSEMIIGGLEKFPNVEKLKEGQIKGEPVIRVGFTVKLLKELLAVFEKEGFKHVYMEIREPEKAVVLKVASEEMEALLMPLKEAGK